MHVNLAPAQLIVGTTTQLLEYTEQFLQKKFCKRAQESSTGCFCAECRKIKNRQHQNVVWITPEKDYTVQDVDIIFDRIRFTLDPGESFFFILTEAQRLTVTTANRILKVLEEPARGYYFVLLSTNAEALLPTIISRCVLIDLSLASGATMALETDKHPIISFFCSSAKRKDPLGFEEELKKQSLNDAQSMELLQRMIVLFAQRLRDTSVQGVAREEQEHITRVIEFLMNKMRKPPQSGSSDLFWKHLFLSFPENN